MWPLALVAGVGLGACLNSRFLEGVRCGDDRDCGRSLRCEDGICGGCPDEGRLDDGTCACAGDRIWECHRVVSPFCVPVCRAEQERCEVMAVDTDGVASDVRSCDDPESDTDWCFTLEFSGTDCGDGEAAVMLTSLDQTDMPETLVVNCPPPRSDETRFSCDDP